MTTHRKFAPLFLVLGLALPAGCGDSSGDGDDEVGETAGTDTDTGTESGTTTTTTTDTTTDTTTETTADTTDTTETTDTAETSGETTETGGTGTGGTDTGGTDTGGTDTGGMLDDGLACGILVGCVDNCPNNDAQCEMDCLAEGGMVGVMEYDAFVACIVDNGCNNQNCVNQNCGAELFACFNGELTCGQLAACAEDCAGDEQCEANCYVQSTPLAKSQADALEACVTDNNCQDEACVVENCGPQLQSCVGGMSDTIPCPLAVECMLDCNGDPVCEDNCMISVTDEAQAEADMAFDCGVMADCNDVDCVEMQCPDEWGVCTTGDASCADLAVCLQSCMGAQLCELGCLTSADPMAQQDFGAVVQCDMANMCAGDEQCLADNCPDELDACGL